MLNQFHTPIHHQQITSLNIRQVKKSLGKIRKQRSSDNLDVIFSELSLPIMISVLYFLYQLPVVRRAFLQTLPMCYSKSGELKLSGYLQIVWHLELLFMLLQKL